MLEQLRIEGAPSIRRLLRSVQDRALARRRQLGAKPKQDRRSREAVGDVLQTIAQLCEYGCHCNADKAISVVELIEDLSSSIGLPI